MTNNKDTLNDFFKSISGEKKKLLDEQKRKKEEKQKIIGSISLDSISLDDFFSSLDEEKRKLKKGVESFKNNLIKEKEEITKTSRLVSNLTGMTVQPKVKNKVKEVVTEQVEENVIDHAVKILDKINEEVETVKTEPDLAKLKKEIELLKQVVYEQGGGGEVRLEFLDDVDRDSVKVDGKFLKYQSSTGKFIGADASGGGGGSIAGISTTGTSVFNQLNVSGIITAPTFVGNLTGNPTGTIQTAAQPNITSLGTLSSLSVSGDVSIGGTLTYEDVTSVDSVGLVTAREGVFIPDNKKIRLGDTSSPDLEIYHDTNHSYISDQGTGQLKILTSTLSVKNASDNKTCATFSPASSVNLFFNGNEKLSTYNSGVTVTGQLDSTQLTVSGISTFTGAIDANSTSNFGDDVTLQTANSKNVVLDKSDDSLTFGDNVKAKFGDGGDVQLYWTGSAGFLTNQGGGNLHFNSDTVLIKNAANNESYIRAYQNSSVELFFDNTKRLETTNTGVSITDNLDVAGIGTFSEGIFLPDNKKAEFGNAAGNANLEIFHDGSSHSYVRTASASAGGIIIKSHNDLQIRTDNLQIKTNSLDNVLTSDINGNVSIGNSLSVSGVSTFSNAIKLKADVTGGSSTNRLYIGAGDDLTLFHDTANSYLQNHTGDLVIGDTNHAYLRGYTSDKSVALFFNNSNKIQTTNTGVVISGIATASNIVSVKSDDGTSGRIDLYCESSNAHYARIQAPAHSAFSGNITLTLPSSTGTLLTSVGTSNIDDDAVSEAKLKVSNSPTDGYFLSAQSGNTGGLTWAAASGGGASMDANSNFVVGTDAGNSLSGDENNNIFIGDEAGYSVDYGGTDGNICIGYKAGRGVNYFGNTFIGHQAAYQAAGTTFNNTVLGASCAGSYTSMSSSVLIGAQAASGTQTTFNNNTVVGMRCGKNVYMNCTLYGKETCRNSSGSIRYINAFGEYAARSVVGESVYLNAFGHESSYSNTSGANNSSFGHKSAYNTNTGSDNTSIGYQAGDLITTGDNNISIGKDSDPSAADADNEITLGNSSNDTIRCNTQTISSLSDARDKTDVNQLELGLDFVDSLKPVKFKWKTRDGNSKDGSYEAGFIAQDFQKVQKDNDADYLKLVHDHNPEKLEASYGKLVPVLVRAIQELKQEIEELKSNV